MSSVFENLPALLFGAGGGGGVLGFVAGHVKVRDHRMKKLEQQVEECRARDADVVILKAGVRLLVGKMRREHPESVELQMFSDLMNQRGFGTDTLAPDSFDDLLKKIDEADEGGKDGLSTD